MLNQNRIELLKGRSVYDSRGVPTVEAEVTLTSGVKASAIAPSGASTGKFEAHELRDGNKKRFGGKGVENAVNAINSEIAPMIAGMDISQLTNLDSMMIQLDGTKQKTRLGANSILAVSLAFAHAAAKAVDLPLYKFIGGNYACTLPIPLINIVNGGKHADNALDFQEFMIIPKGLSSFKESLRCASEFFMALKSYFKQKGLSTNVGDEGGFAPNLSSSRQVLDILMEVGLDSGLKIDGKTIGLGMDVAASEFYQKGKYLLEDGKKSLTSEKMIDELADLCSNYPILSIEDGLDEEDWQGWQQLTSRLGNSVQLVGDDLFVTDKERLTTGVKKKIANSILVKVNQIGSLSETVETVKYAHGAGYRCVMSHRSGESEDTTIADLAVGLSCDQIKTGSMSRSDRMAKYNRLLRIEEELGNDAMYAGASDLENSLKSV